MEMKRALGRGLRPRTLNFNVAGLLSRDDAKTESQIVKKENFGDISKPIILD